MNVFKPIYLFVLLLAGYAVAETDLQKRQQCISKCLDKNKGKAFRPFHRTVVSLNAIESIVLV